MADGNIFEVLREDHQKQRTLLDLVDKTQGASDGRDELFERLRNEAIQHADVEERVFYSVLLGEELTNDKAGHSIREHKEAEEILDELTEKELDDKGWLTRFRTLAKDLRHHMDEEESEVFQLAGKVLSEEQKRSLAKRFLQEKRSE